MEAESIEIKAVQGELPMGWQWKTMEEVSEVVNGATPKTGDPANYEGGTIAWLTPADLSGYTEKYIDQGVRFITKRGLESCSTNLLPKGTVLFTSRAPIGYVAIASGEVCTNQGFKSYVPDTTQITSDYLYWWLKGAKSMAEAVASGTTFLELSTAKARKLPIPLAPLPEQRRIVAAIETQLGRLDAAVASLHAAKAKLKRYKQAVLKAAVEGRLTKEWREKNAKLLSSEGLLQAVNKEHQAVWEKEQLDLFAKKGKTPKDGKWKEKYSPPVPVDAEPLPDLPEGWNWIRIGTVGFVTKLAGFEYTEFVKYDPSGDLAVIKAENASRDGFRPTDYSKVRSETVAHLTRSKLIPGDMLIVFVGSIGNVGRVPDDQPYFLGPNIGMVRVESKHVSPAYLEYFLRSPIGNHLINSFAKAVTQPSLSMGSIRLIPFAMPPIEEQERIIAALEEKLDKQAAMEATLDTQLIQSKRLRQSVLKRAFEGRLV